VIASTGGASATATVVPGLHASLCVPTRTTWRGRLD
jgi:hypothetical protein